jgi:serine/threonine protein kinase|eukprot:COSAG06_NODE_512_length_14867_cov_28.794962_4_plen_159_part_00
MSANGVETTELADTAKLGEGAGCIGVYAAVDTRDGRSVAVKTVDRTREGACHTTPPPNKPGRLARLPRSQQSLTTTCANPGGAVDSTWKHSFQRELDIAIKLQHPNVIEIYDVIFWDRSVLQQLAAQPTTLCCAAPSPPAASTAPHTRSVLRAGMCAL